MDCGCKYDVNIWLKRHFNNYDMKMHKIIDNCCALTKEQCFRVKYGRRPCSPNPSQDDIKKCIIELMGITKDLETEIIALDELVENLKDKKTLIYN